MDLPPELIERVVWRLSNVDLGNLAMTCRQMRDWLDPKLAGRLKRLIWADPNVVQLIRPQQPETYGITQRDKLASDTLPEVEALAVRDNLRDFTEELYACPLLAKYVKHVFIDYRKFRSDFSEEIDSFYAVEDVELAGQFMRYSKLEGPDNHDHASNFWMSTCGLAAMILLKLTNVESLVLVGCNSHGFRYCRDPIKAALSAALTPGRQQKLLRRLKYIYAWGCCYRDGSGYAPWNFVVLPSLKTLECQEVSGLLPVAAGRYGDIDDHILRYTPKWDPVLHLETLILRQQGLDTESYFKILKYTPYLKRLSYQCISISTRRLERSRGLHLAKLRSAIQPLSECLEELAIEVAAMQDLWGSNASGTEVDYVDAESDDGDSLYHHNVDENDSDDEDGSDDEDDSEDEDNGEDEEIDWEKELISLSLKQELKQLKQHYGPYQNLWATPGIRNIPNVAIEDIRASLDRSSLPPDISEPSWDDQQPEFLGSLTHFTKLRNVAVPAIVLQDPWPYAGHSQNKSVTVYSDGTAMSGARKHLKDLLPKSIERLTLFKLKGMF